MAYKVVLYSIEGSVGKGGVNKPDDVRLVQALIVANAAVFDFTGSAAKLNLKLSTLALTGVCDDNLINWIKVCENGLCSHHNPDGRIDKVDIVPVEPGSSMGVKNGCIRRTFTALVFNLALTNLDEYRKLESKVTMPQKVY